MGMECTSFFLTSTREAHHRGFLAVCLLVMGVLCCIKIGFFIPAAKEALPAFAKTFSSVSKRGIVRNVFSASLRTHKYRCFKEISDYFALNFLFDECMIPSSAQSCSDFGIFLDAGRAKHAFTFLTADCRMSNSVAKQAS